ncbi:MAG: flavodoxin family protein [Nitrospinae bacterium]|nr:flavodoxin family protein [Nitrospinota bacterium]
MTKNNMVLGLSGSLRNARYRGNVAPLLADLRSLATEVELADYLARETKVRHQAFFEAGRDAGLPFDEIFANLQSEQHRRGLSNSEAALAAGLWGALQGGADISYASLADYFAVEGKSRDLDHLRSLVLAADAFLISGPVYFGDRGSLTQSFIEFLTADAECAAHVRGKVYGGIAVGAKRNGGQETTLIYQIVDMTNLYALAVGNDSRTTSQYGGTVLAGDVGTMAGDAYGFGTAVGTGARVAAVTALNRIGGERSLADDARIAVWLLQDDTDGRGGRIARDFMAAVEADVPGVRFDLLDITAEEVRRCIACDLCPVRIGPRNDYRCVIAAGSDWFVRNHTTLVEADAIIVAAYSPVDRGDVRSVYQQFIERTRYLRRDDYVFANRLVAPMIISEVGSDQNLRLRAMTSMVRHNTILHHPLIVRELDGALLRWESFVSNGVRFAETARRLTAGRIAAPDEVTGRNHYRPVGYVISKEKDGRDRESEAFEAVEKGRVAQREAERARLRPA